VMGVILRMGFQPEQGAQAWLEGLQFPTRWHKDFLSEGSRVK